MGEPVLSRLNKAAIWLSTRFGYDLFRRVSGRYVAGENLDEAMREVLRYAKEKRYSTLSILGEDATTKVRADYYLFAYKRVIDLIAGKQLTKVCSVSVKPTAICAVDDKHRMILPSTPLHKRLIGLAAYAKRRGIRITLDMEDHHWTDITLNAAKAVWKRGYDNVGITLQSCLHRTQRDVIDLFKKSSFRVSKERIHVRAVRGIYSEPRRFAVQSKKKAKKRLLNRIVELLNAGVYVEIATHDKEIIDLIVNKVILPKDISPDRFEFQFLKGVPVAYEIDQQLIRRGFTVRYYMPVEISLDDGVPYMTRRLINNPRTVWELFCALFTGRRSR